MIRRIDHVSLAVRDLDQARAFFLGILGGRELFSMAIAGSSSTAGPPSSWAPPASWS
jgi:catechol 2,3-dioxygenase-like lactoylglutathione lyase family enzyme